MKKVIKPGRARKSINFIDNIVYSRQKDLEGNEMELKMSIMLQNGNSEMRLASGHDDEADDKTPKPAILWVPGGGYRGCDKNLMVAEMAFLADAGYDMIGVDLSEEMLQIAVQKEAEEPRGILYLEQDMREFELYGTVHAVVSICDSMNYLMEYEDLVQVVRLANNYLDPHGVFIFDLNTVYKYREELGEQTIAENREESSFIWENFYDEEEMVNEYDLTLFIREEDGRYGKYEETHYQRAYELETVKKAIAEGGMELVAIYDAFTHEAPTEESERVYVIARERGKE